MILYLKRYIIVDIVDFSWIFKSFSFSSYWNEFLKYIIFIIKGWINCFFLKDWIIVNEDVIYVFYLNVCDN